MGLENPTHWIPIVVILLLLFGAKRLPEIGRSLGSGMREFKQSITGGPGEPEQQALPQGQQPAAAQVPVAPVAAQAPAPVAAQAPAPVAAQPSQPEPTQQV